MYQRDIITMVTGHEQNTENNLTEIVLIYIAIVYTETRWMSGRGEENTRKTEILLRGENYK